MGHTLSTRVRTAIGTRDFIITATRTPTAIGTWVTGTRTPTAISTRDSITTATPPLPLSVHGLPVREPLPLSVRGKSWTRLSEQFFRFDMWSSAGVRLPSGEAAA